jgi:hypothetical protein
VSALPVLQFPGLLVICLKLKRQSIVIFTRVNLYRVGGTFAVTSSIRNANLFLRHPFCVQHYLLSACHTQTLCELAVQLPLPHLSVEIPRRHSGIAIGDLGDMHSSRASECKGSRPPGLRFILSFRDDRVRSPAARRMTLSS